jgi:hypothetical protein
VRTASPGGRAGTTPTPRRPAARAAPCALAPCSPPFAQTMSAERASEGTLTVFVHTGRGHGTCKGHGIRAVRSPEAPHRRGTHSVAHLVGAAGRGPAPIAGSLRLQRDFVRCYLRGVGWVGDRANKKDLGIPVDWRIDLVAGAFGLRFLAACWSACCRSSDSSSPSPSRCSEWGLELIISLG